MKTKQLVNHFASLYAEEILAKEVTMDCIYEWWMQTCGQYNLDSDDVDDTQEYESFERAVLRLIAFTDEEEFMVAKHFEDFLRLAEKAGIKQNGYSYYIQTYYHCYDTEQTGCELLEDGNWWRRNQNV